MQNRVRIAVVFAIAFGLIAAYGIAGFLRKQREAMEKYRNSTQAVVVAAKEIPAGTTLTADMVEINSFLKTSLPAGVFSSPEAVTGKITKTAIATGEPVLESRLGAKAGLTVLLSPGQRAMAVKVNEVIGVSGFITPNDRVDVIANVIPPGANGNRKSQISKIVLQNKRVLSVSQSAEVQKDGKPQIASSITLELTPEEVEKLSLASMEGQIVLALRSQQDDAIVRTPGSTTRDLLEISVPRKKRVAVARKYRVQVYMGGERSVIEF